MRGAAHDAAEKAPRPGRKKAEAFNTYIPSGPGWTMQEADQIRFNVGRHVPEGADLIIEMLLD